LKNSYTSTVFHKYLLLLQYLRLGKDPHLHFQAAGAPLKTHCQLTSQQQTLSSGTNLDETQNNVLGWGEQLPAA